MGRDRLRLKQGGELTCSICTFFNEMHCEIILVKKMFIRIQDSFPFEYTFVSSCEPLIVMN